MLYKDKSKLRDDAIKFLCLVDSCKDRYQLLRAYNLWYSKALEFVTVHAKCRLKEFEERHASNQCMLCDLNCGDFRTLKMNVLIQTTIIEACEDHTYHLV